MKDHLLETLLALRIMYWRMNTTHDRRKQIEDNIKQHTGHATA